MASDLTMYAQTSIPVQMLVLDSYGNGANGGSQIIWESSDPTIAILSMPSAFVSGTPIQNSVSTNTIQALKGGSCVITVSILGGSIIGTIDLTVNQPPPASLQFIFGTAM